MSETEVRYSFGGEWDTEQMDQFAKNRGFESRSEYFRYLIRQDIQDQIGQSELTVVPTDD